MSKWSASPWGLQSSSRPPKEIAPPPPRKKMSRGGKAPPPPAPSASETERPPSKNTAELIPPSNFTTQTLSSSNKKRSQKKSIPTENEGAQQSSDQSFNSYAAADTMLTSTGARTSTKESQAESTSSSVYDGIPHELNGIGAMPEKNRQKNVASGHLKAIELLDLEQLGRVPLREQLRGLHMELEDEERDFGGVPKPIPVSGEGVVGVEEPFYFDSQDRPNLLPPTPLAPTQTNDSASLFLPLPLASHAKKAQPATLPGSNLGPLPSKREKNDSLPPVPSVDAFYSNQLHIGATGGQQISFQAHEHEEHDVEQQQEEQGQEQEQEEEQYAGLIIDPSRIRKLDMIGEGYFGQVWRGVWDGSLAVALKGLKHGVRTQADKTKFFSEVSSLAKMRHPNITVFYGATPPPQAYIISELMQCSLFQLIYAPNSKDPPPLPMKVILRILSDVSYGGNYLHNMKPHAVIHRDLTSSNVLLTVPAAISDQALLEACADPSKPLAKLTDFGLSREVDWCMTACVGNLFYLAPEVYTGEHYTQSADIYSFGVLMWETVARRSPHAGLNPQRVAFLAATQQLRPPLALTEAVTSTAFGALNSRCWHADPKGRPSFREISVLLQHMGESRDRELEEFSKIGDETFARQSLTIDKPQQQPQQQQQQQQVHRRRYSPDQQSDQEQQQFPDPLPDPWAEARRTLSNFLQTRPGPEQLTGTGLEGEATRPWYLREYLDEQEGMGNWRQQERGEH